jgi:flavin-dependent dehydrogenase
MGASVLHGNCFDIVVIGAGPAGCGAAITARRLGRSVALLDRMSGTTCNAVERMAPTTRSHLAEWELLDRMTVPVAQECSSVLSAWDPYAPPRMTHALFEPHGGGWIVERDAFDRLLRMEALHRGASLVRGDVSAVNPRRSGWTIRFERDGSSQTLQAKHIALAAGRATSLTRMLTSRTNSSEKWIATLGRTRHCDPAWQDDPCLFVEKTANGWMYGMPAPAQGAFIGVCVPAHLLTASPRQSPTEIWSRAVAHSRIRPPCDADADAEVWCRSMTGCVAAQVVGDSWALVGDTARTVDPLSGLGVAFALESGRRAVEEPGTYADWVRAFTVMHDSARAALYGVSVPHP